MPSGGQDLAAPPIRVWAAAARAQSAVLLNGANWYSQGAGGFDQVFAIPQLVRLQRPANPNSAANQKAAQIYATSPTNRKQRLESQFGTI
jgi:hypothetical protein